MADEQQSRNTRDRSPGFPFISLERALERAQQFYKHEKRGAAPFDVAAAHWGYSPTSSGALQTAAALKQYGLIADEDGGKNRKLRLTDAALRILLDVRPESPEREELKCQAASMPPVAAEVYEKWPDGLPSEGTLNHFLVFERGFNPQTAVKTIRILLENEGFTSRPGRGIISSDTRTEYESIMAQPWYSSKQNPARVADTFIERQISRMPMPPTLTTSVGSLVAGGNCTLTIVASGGPVTQEALEKLIKYVELVKDGFPKADTKQVEALVSQDEVSSAPNLIKVR